MIEKSEFSVREYRRQTHNNFCISVPLVWKISTLFHDLLSSSITLSLVFSFYGPLHQITRFPVFCLPFCHTKQLNILFHWTRKSPLSSSPFVQPACSICSILLPMYSLFLVFMCLNRVSLARLTLSPGWLTLAVPSDGLILNPIHSYHSQRKSPGFSSTRSLLSLHITVSSAHHRPWRLPSDLTCQPVHHHETRKGLSLIQSHLQLKPSVTPTAKLTAVTQSLPQHSAL